MSATAATGTTTATAILPGADKPLEPLSASAPEVEGGAVAEVVDEDEIDVEGVGSVTEGKLSEDCVEVMRTVTGWLFAPVLISVRTVGPATGMGATGVVVEDVDEEEVDVVDGNAAGACVVELGGTMIVGGREVVWVTGGGTLVAVSVSGVGANEKDVGVVGMP